jgi:hypothetical protein
VNSAAFLIILLTGLYLVALGTVALLAPGRAIRFLMGFAASPGLHYTELLVRLAVGSALVVQAPRMLWPDLFRWFGYCLMATTAMLALVPWRWHCRLAERSVSQISGFILPIGLASAGFGAGILLALLRAV